MLSRISGSLRQASVLISQTGSRSCAAVAQNSADAPSYVIEEVTPVFDDEADELRKAWFTKKNVRGSTKKFELLARQLRGLSVNEAVAQMAFSAKARGSLLKYCINRAVSKADFFHGLTHDQLLIDEVLIGEGLKAPRARYHSRGRMGRAAFRTSHVTIKLREMTEEERGKLNKFSTARKVVSAEEQPRLY
jgi:large subunit ribosomal protein L22